MELPNGPASGVGIARFALAAFVVLWIALVAWALRNEERLFTAPPGPAAAKADAGSDADANADANADTGSDDGAGIPGTARTSTDAPASDRPGSVGPVVETAVTLAPSPATEPILASGPPSVADTEADTEAEAEPVDDVATSGSEADALPGSASEPRAPDNAKEVSEREVADAAVTPVEAVEALPPVESAFEIRRREELDTLATLLSAVAFEPLGDTLVDEARERLERAFEILFLYSRTRVELVVESRETSDPAESVALDRARGQRVVDYLVSRGIERDRLVVETGEGRGLPFGEHRVRVSVEDEER